MSFSLLTVVNMLQIIVVIIIIVVPSIIIIIIVFFYGRTYNLCTDSVCDKFVRHNLKISHYQHIYNCCL